MTTAFFFDPAVLLHSSYFRYQILSTVWNDVVEYFARSVSSIVGMAYVTPVAQLPRITYGFHPS